MAPCASPARTTRAIAMTDNSFSHPVLAQVVLGYSPVIDRQRAVAATRLTVFPQRADAADAAGAEMAALLAALGSIWPMQAAQDSAEALTITLRPVGPGGAAAAAAAPAPAAAPASLPPLWLNLASEPLLRAALAASPGAGVAIEVPAFLAADAGWLGLLQSARSAGCVLALRGVPRSPLGDAAACFSLWALDAGDDARAAMVAAQAAGLPRLPVVRAGLSQAAELDAALQGGAQAAQGWPVAELPKPSPTRRNVPPDVQAVMALIQGVNQEAPVAKLEAELKRDPGLAFRLMRYLNSPAFGLTVEINSFGHALMLLGYQRLKRWLALLLASSTKDANAKPIMYAAVRRGLLMEELVRSQGDNEMGGEMFICGVFSLLDRLLGQPLPELLASVPVPERVHQALSGTGGPYLPYLDLVRAIEAESAFDIRERCEALMLSPIEVNRALLLALKAARQLD
jgi:c-di-GMP phosphodiesterase